MRTGMRISPAVSPSWPTIAGATAVLLTPLVLLAFLRLRPELDLHWANHPAHFWIVLVAAGTASALGYATMVASRRRRDARLLLVTLALLSGSGFLGLHALSTPGVLLGPNAGFDIASPVGLALGSVLVAISGLDLTVQSAQRILARSRWLWGGLVAILVTWAVLSLAGLPPLDEPAPPDALLGWQLGLAAFGAAGYGIGALGYLRLYRRRGTGLVLSLVVSSVLLAETMIVIALAVNWRLSWWQWHVMMLVAFALLARAAGREWHEERFSPLYLEHTLAGARDVTVLFADLQGFTAYSERTSPREVTEMLNAYFSVLVPLMHDLGGEVHQLIGDAIMVVFNRDGGQPDHALLAARAGLAFQEAAANVARADWPPFRVGVNSGEVLAGVVGDRGHRKHDVIGDTVNLASRLESVAPAGEVVIGEGTFARLPDGVVAESLPAMQVKGKEEPVTAYVLRALPS